MKFSRSPMALAVALALPLLAQAQEGRLLDEMVVTAPRMDEPLKIVTDPKQPRQPLPAHDGADFLKTIPGFTVIRKGGTDGDPVLRGMAGSRLNILLDGEHILGGCGGRMDPPTAYVFPESYDRVTVIKGPQSVMHGPGSAAGSVLFERDIKRLAAPGVKANGSVMVGSFGRHDEVVDITGGTPDYYVRGTATNTHANDYEDGDGRKVHSAYERWSANAAIGWTPDANTRLELSLATSDGNAAYADRMMDGVLFKRENVGLKFTKKKLSPLVEEIDAQLYYNYIDHVMDNYSLRGGNPATGMVSNPDRLTWGGRLTTTLRLADPTQLKLGLDHQTNQHTLRTGNGLNYQANARTEDGLFHQTGLFGEVTHFLTEQQRLIGGLRVDAWKARDQRSGVASAGQNRSETLTSGFGRYEQDLDAHTTVYAGLGHSERFPDFWELFSQGKQSLGSNSAFGTAPEKTTQLDVGAIYKAGQWSASVSGFYGRINDYILIDNSRKLKNALLTRNVDATTWGGEAGLAYAFNANWKADATLAYVRGDNDTDGTALAQLPPLEMRLGLTYDNRVWSVGSLLRLVSSQDRIDPLKGNIVGQDIGATGGFAIFSINAGYRPKKGVLISGGIDNLFDRTYAEHISKAGSMIAGYTQTTRVNEPGRTAWLKAQIALD
ncbi:MAG: TonB-dependent copper receptor [Proteobacteria bacterium]|nr:TonB-dependent copper receptor [Azonexus sp.]MDA0190672.1 TonB-dependent copper receptor [Pseudomonadota bacterium]